MTMRKTFLVTLTFAVDADDSKPAGGGLPEIERIERRLVERAEAELGATHPLGWQAAWHLELNPLEVNCGQCSVCKGWVSDVERPNPLRGLGIGARVEGRLLCDEHLPAGHPLAF